jgi:hypothetical protein
MGYYEVGLVLDQIRIASEKAQSHCVLGRFPYAGNERLILLLGIDCVARCLFGSRRQIMQPHFVVKQPRWDRFDVDFVILPQKM